MAQHATSESELNKHAIMKGQVLMVCTSCDAFANGEPTGLWLGELAEPYWILKDAGYDITIASPRGGAVPVDAASLAPDVKGPESERMLTDDEAKLVLQHSVPLSDIISDATYYDVVFLPGGHGPCFDLAADTMLADILTRANGAGKLIAAVCHGPVGLVLAKGDDGTPLVAGRRVTGFTNSEEVAVGKDKMVPFLLEDRLVELGAQMVREPDWQECVVEDGNLITGQNPGSARGVGRAILRQLDERRQKLGERASGGVTLTAGEAGLVGSGAQ